MRDILFINNVKNFLDIILQKYYDFKQIEKKPLRKSSKQDLKESQRAAGGGIAA